MILFLGPEHAFKIVKDVFSNVVHCHTEEDIDRHIGNADIVFDASIKFQFNEKRLSMATSLRLFVTASTGTAHIDSRYLKSKNITLFSLLGRPEIKNITSAAEHSWFLLMAAIRQSRSSVRHVLDGKWDRLAFDLPMLRGKALGIIGCGRIGTWMGRYATAFGVTVMGYDPHITEWEFHISNFETVLLESDFISVNTSYSQETKGLIGKDQFQMMKYGSVFVNTSHGDIIDEEYLVQALETGQISAAGVDVVSGEPCPVNNPLIEYAVNNENLIITPHIAGRSKDALEYVVKFSCRRIEEWIEEHEKSVNHK